MKRTLVILAAALALAAPAAAYGHAPVVHNGAGTVRTWTHADHAADPIGVVACVQNRHGVTFCVNHGNLLFKYRSPWPQVPAAPNPATWASTGTHRTVAPAGFEWWWSRFAPPSGGEGVCIYDNRPFVPGSGTFNFNNFACLGPNETTLDGPSNGNVRFPLRLPVETVVSVPPADFIRPAI